MDLTCHETIICVYCTGLITTETEIEQLCMSCILRLKKRADHEAEQLQGAIGLSEKYLEDFWFRFWRRVHIQEMHGQTRITDYFKTQKRNKYQPSGAFAPGKHTIFNADHFVKSMLH